MKIAFLTPEYPHQKTGASGGIGTSIKNLATGLIANGVETRVLVYGQNTDGEFKDDNITIQQIKNVKIKGLSWYLTRKKIERIINKLHEENKIDAIEAPDWTGITSYIKPKKCPIVIRLHGSDTYFCHLDNRSVKWSNKFHEKKALQNANGYISVSQFTATLTNKLFHQNYNFAIIPNGIDCANFSIETPNSKTSTILYFGTLIRKKGLLELPLIFNLVVEKNPEAKLLLVGKDSPDIISGNTSTWEMMKPLFTQKAFSNVIYIGAVPYNEMKKQIQEATICVFPTFAEALPVSWLEAMAMRKGIVASNIGWAKEIIDDGIDGYLVDPKNHIDYAQKINNLLNDFETLNTFSKNAVKKINTNFDINIIAKKTFSYYNNLLRK